MTDDQSRVLRIFRGFPVDAAAVAAFEAKSLSTSISAVKAHQGLLAFVVLRPIDPSQGWLFLTMWESEDAVRAYAGEHWQAAVLPPGYAELLREVVMEHHHVLAAGWAQPVATEQL